MARFKVQETLVLKCFCQRPEHLKALLSLDCDVQHTSAWSTTFPEQLTVPQLIKKFPTFYGTGRPIATFTSALHLSLSWARPIQFMPPHPTSWRSILIYSSLLCLGRTSGLFPSGGFLGLLIPKGITVLFLQHAPTPPHTCDATFHHTLYRWPCLSTAALPHRKPASAKTLRDICHAQRRDKADTCTYLDKGDTCTYLDKADILNITHLFNYFEVLISWHDCTFHCHFRFPTNNNCPWQCHIGLKPQVSRDHGFETHRGHGYRGKCHFTVLGSSQAVCRKMADRSPLTVIQLQRLEIEQTGTFGGNQFKETHLHRCRYDWLYFGTATSTVQSARMELKHCEQAAAAYFKVVIQYLYISLLYICISTGRDAEPRDQPKYHT